MNILYDFFQKKDRLLYILAFAALFLISAILTFVILWKDTKEVKLYFEDQMKELSTTAKTVSELLAEEGVAVGEYDLVWPEKETKITNHLSILVIKAKPVTIKVGREPERIVWTTSQTVERVLQEIGYRNQREDIIKPDLHQPIEANQKIEVTHVTYRLIEESQELKFNTVRIADNTMVKGSEKVVSQGEPGEKVVTYKATYYNGEMVDLDPLRTEVTDPPKEKVVHYGTVESITVGGYTFLPKKTLKNVKLTAYSAGEDHTGKKPGDPGYAMTRSGVRASEGRTIAVDPDLIPLGWWVYIDGYGLYRAEDTGGAVKGKIIDVYFEDDQKVAKFGVKRGRTVYVIGPDKPTKKN